MTIAERILERVREYYVPPKTNGTIVINVRGHANRSFALILDEKCTLAGASMVGDLNIEISLGLLEYMLNNPDTLELRGPPYAQTLRYSGSDALLSHFSQLMKRPDPNTARIAAALRNSGRVWANQIQVETIASEETILAAANKSQPLCVRGVIRSEVTRWDLSQLEAAFGSVVLRKHSNKGPQETLADFIRSFRASDEKRIYTNGCPIPEECQEAFAFPFFRRDDFRSSRLWFGKKRRTMITNLHCDFQISLLGHFWGRKKVDLYSPDQCKYLYGIESFNTYQTCRVDPDFPDFFQFPLFRNAQSLSITLEPGDLLVIPTGWYHCVWALDDVLSVSHFMEEGTAQALGRTL